MPIIFKKKKFQLLKKKLVLLIIILVFNLSGDATLCEEFSDKAIEKSTNTDKVSYKNEFIFLGLTIITCIVIYFVFFNDSASNALSLNNTSTLFYNNPNITWVDVSKNNMPYIQLSSELVNTVYWTNMSVNEYLKVLPGNTLVAFLDYTPEFYIDPDTVIYKITTLEEVRNLNLNLSSHI